MICICAAAVAEDWQSHADILAVAASTARDSAMPHSSRSRAVAEPLDPRLQLAACSQPLVGKIPFNRGTAAPRLTVEVRCGGPQPWKVYVPVRLARFQSVVVVKRALARGAILAPGDVGLAERDIGSLPRGYLLDIGQAVGQRLRRAIVSGQVLTPSGLDRPPMIRRGQHVTVEAHSGGMTVRMAGIAKSNGAFGQVIDVQSISSKRRIQAIVRSKQSVEVLLN